MVHQKDACLAHIKPDFQSQYNMKTTTTTENVQIYAKQGWSRSR